MKQGFFDQSFTALETSTNVTSNSYAYSNVLNAGTIVQAALSVKATLGAGVTSVELKFQQAFAEDAAEADWYSTPLVDTTNKVTVSNEFVAVAKPLTIRIDASTGSTGALGPFPFFWGLPYGRLAYKISGVGTANIGAIISRATI